MDPAVDDLEARLVHGGGRLERHPDGDWRVRPVTGAAATKSYLCPGCQQQIPPGTPHVVTWPADRLGAFSAPGTGQVGPAEQQQAVDSSPTQETEPVDRTITLPAQPAETAAKR